MTKQKRAIQTVVVIALLIGSFSAASTAANADEPEPTGAATPQTAPSPGDATSEANNPPDPTYSAPSGLNSPKRAGDGSYSAADAVHYAVKWSCNDDPSCRNPDYRVQAQDCTNFVSQALYAGGLAKDYQWTYNEFLDRGSEQWVKVSSLQAWLEKNQGSFKSLTKIQLQSNANVPDGAVIEYDWGDGQGWDHFAMVTGTGTYANFYDKTLKQNYRSMTAQRAGTRITQHTKDRDGSPWNLGYYTNRMSYRDKARAQWLLPH